MYRGSDLVVYGATGIVGAARLCGVARPRRAHPLIRVSVFNEHVADMRHVADVGAVALYGLIEVLVRNRPVNHPTRPCPEPVRRASKTH
jgi:hypothetical protein